MYFYYEKTEIVPWALCASYFAKSTEAQIYSRVHYTVGKFLIYYKHIKTNNTIYAV